MGQLHARDIPRRVIKIHAEGRTLLKHLAVIIGKCADPQLGPLQVCQNTHARAHIRLDLTNDRVPLAEFFVGAVAHIEPEHIRARLVQCTDRVVVTRRWPKGCDYLYIAVPSHLTCPSSFLLTLTTAALILQFASSRNVSDA